MVLDEIIDGFIDAANTITQWCTDNPKKADLIFRGISYCVDTAIQLTSDGDPNDHIFAKAVERAHSGYQSGYRDLARLAKEGYGPAEQFISQMMGTVSGLPGGCARPSICYGPESVGRCGPYMRPRESPFGPVDWDSEESSSRCFDGRRSAPYCRPSYGPSRPSKRARYSSWRDAPYHRAPSYSDDDECDSSDDSSSHSDSDSEHECRRKAKKSKSKRKEKCKSKERKCKDDYSPDDVD